jgi:hypothetical protein
LSIYESCWSAGDFDVDILLARTRYKLAQVLYGLHGKCEEGDDLSHLSSQVLTKRLGYAAPTDLEEIEKAYNSLLFYWNR